MAPSRVTEQEKLVDSSSEDEESQEENEEELEEEEEEEEGESEEESEGEDAAPAPTPPPKASLDKQSYSKKPSSVPVAQKPSSSSESDSESGSESDSEPEPSPEKPRRSSVTVDSDVKPLASKPMDNKEKETTRTTKPRSRPVASDTTPKRSASAKRPIESAIDAKGPKRTRKKITDENAEEDTGKRSRVLWSGENEHALLKGTSEYITKKGVDPSSDMNAFHDFMKKFLQPNVTKIQLGDKLRNLKKKYESNAGKGKRGEDVAFSKPHEQKTYELSKKIWGGGGESVNGAEQSVVDGKRQNSKSLVSLLSDPREASKTGDEDDSVSAPSLTEYLTFAKKEGMNLQEAAMEKLVGLLGSGKLAELDEKWKKLQVAEMEVFLMKLDLVKEQTTAIIQALKTSK
ncbi:STOREKEEPER protein-like [Malania oleifera]|uniref:STOREKEEPER protein-like n=1 Tax=Malania oleifera TaxID=397392 RepID=UPI0025ADC5A3|nr:STOREKEEPER protein-like [Malania oleifera]